MSIPRRLTLDMRPELALVASLVRPGSRVLDLGCGSGALLRHLIDEQDCRGLGVDKDPASVLSAIRQGVPLVELDLDRELDEFADDSYDVVVLSRTLQATHKPAEVLRQMGRIGRRCVVSMPNFGLWRHRLRLLRGRMPMSRELPHAWHDTPNIHHATLVELELLFAALGFAIERRVVLSDKGHPLRWSTGAANLRGGAAVYVLVPERAQAATS